MDFKCYSRTKEFQVVSAVQKDNMRLTVTRITESNAMYSRVYYNVCMIDGALRIFDSVESNTGRLWHIYDTVRISMVYGR